MTKKTFKGERFPWVVAAGIVHALENEIEVERGFFGGSYLRMQKDCGDLDLAIVRNTNTNASLQKMIARWNGQFLVGGIGGAQCRLVLTTPADVDGVEEGFKFQLDVWFHPESRTFGPMCMFVAGSGRFNVYQRSDARKIGYVLSQNGVYKNGKSVEQDLPDEQSVYKLFGWKWIPYEKRSLG